MKISEMPVITVEVTINVPVTFAWKYFSEPEHITKWNYAIDAWHCPRADNDLRVGGKLNSRMEAKDGSMGFDFSATYNEVEENMKQVYTLDDGRKVLVHFTDLGDRSKVTQVFEAEDSNSVEMQKDGWQAILNNFKRHAESF